jgi:hypothetical protein
MAMCRRAHWMRKTDKLSHLRDSFEWWKSPVLQATSLVCHGGFQPALTSTLGPKREKESELCFRILFLVSHSHQKDSSSERVSTRVSFSQRCSAGPRCYQVAWGPEAQAGGPYSGNRSSSCWRAPSLKASWRSPAGSLSPPCGRSHATDALPLDPQLGWDFY